MDGFPMVTFTIQLLVSSTQQEAIIVNIHFKRKLATIIDLGLRELVETSRTTFCLITVFNYSMQETRIFRLPPLQRLKNFGLALGYNIYRVVEFRGNLAFIIMFHPISVLLVVLCRPTLTGFLPFIFLKTGIPLEINCVNVNFEL